MARVSPFVNGTLTHTHTHYVKSVLIGAFVVQLRESTDQKNSKYKHFSGSERRVHNTVKHLHV